MKNIKLVLITIFMSLGLFAQEVHTSYLWHMQQPIYWPEISKANPNRYQTVFESFNLKQSGDPFNIYDDGKSHPLNDLQEIFGKYDRVKAYQYGPKNSVQTLLSLPNGGTQVNYSGCLIENVNSLADAGVWGYYRGWQNEFIQARDWKTSGGQPRMDLTGFTFHHALAPLISERALRMELKTHRIISDQTFGGSYSKGFWPAECSFSERIIKVLVEEGFEWSVIANSHLARTLQDYPINYGTSGTNIDPPNAADKVATKGVNWWNGQIDGRGGTFAAPYTYQAHKAQYVDPETGQAYKLDVVPMADLLSYQNGFSSMGTDEIDKHITPFSTQEHPTIILLAHDGDNAWGGGDSYYQESVPGFANEAASKGYSPTTIQQFLNSYPVPGNDIVKVEDGSWVNAANDWGHPQFINWLWPLYDASNYRFNPNGWTEDARNWAVITAAENYVITAEDLDGNVNPAQVINPTGSASSAEKAWHFFLPSLTSGYMYYGKAIDMEVKQTVADNIAIDHALNVINGRLEEDTTPPSVFIPQRFPYNPGGKGFGPIYGYKEVQNSSDFHVWTFAHDISGLASIELKYRTDDDGKNPISDTANETYSGGQGVGAWISKSMSRKAFPKGNITNDPEIDLFIVPTDIADLCYAEIKGLSNVLVDYYVEATDTKGNVFKTPIQHVFVGEFNSSDEVTLSITPESGNNLDTIEISMEAETTAENATVAIYYTLDGSEPDTTSNLYNGVFDLGNSESEAITVKAIAYDTNDNASEVITRNYTFGELDAFDIHFKNTSNWSNVYVYLYDKNNDSALPGWSWPGELMTNEQNSPWFVTSVEEAVEVGIVFTNGAGEQSDDTFRTSEGWYVLSENTWYDNCPSDCPGILDTPILTVDTSGGTYEGSVSITLTATNNGVIYYTTDGSTPTASSASYTGNLTFTATTTLKAIAINSTGTSNLIEEVYEITPVIDSDYTVHFRNTNQWNEVYIYVFNRDTNTPVDGWNWPGKPMSREQASEWYAFNIKESGNLGIVFNDNNNGAQTDDLTRNSTGWYDLSTNQWYDSCPAACPGDDNPDDTENLVIHFNNSNANWNNVTLYFWNTSPGVMTTSWPGVAMTDDDGDGWFDYTLPSVSCANVIFSNNGSDQTADLQICGEGWYDGAWISNPQALSAKSSTTTIKKQEQISSAYPNPFINAVNFYIGGTDKTMNVTVYDTKGALHYSDRVTITNGTISIPLDVATGIYFVRFRNKSVNKVVKIVK
ncbi:starch-binding protein [Tenacibaculum agarivorans]|uniref:starch-binding protein n=1 Tax=Tenacibaculum agarivorans TaxID=1908389 RepID=UPI0009FAD829|nr:starch-binding protein [Tenacibaculum agarivorans]